MKKLVYLVCFTILINCLYSCVSNKKSEENETKVIKIDVESKRIGKSIKIKDIIPLETTKESLIGTPKTVLFRNNHIIVLDERGSKALLVFDKSGKLVFKSRNGKGPGEIISPRAVNVCDKDTTILLYDFILNTFFKYDYDGTIIDSKLIKAPTALDLQNFYQLDKDSFLIFHAIRSEFSKDEPRRTTCSLLTDSLKKVQQFNITLNRNKRPFYVTNPAYVSKDQILFVVPWCYDVFQLSGTNYSVKYNIDFGNAGFSMDQLEELSAENLVELMKSDNKVGCLLSVMFCHDKLIIDAAVDRGSKVFVHSFSNMRTINIDNYIQRGILPKCRIWGVNQDGIMYATVEPESLIDFIGQERAMSELKISLNSNPILITFQIDDIF